MTREEVLNARGRAEGRAELLPLLNEKDVMLNEKEKEIAELKALIQSQSK